jgi:peptidoglycan/xylan/chitin deacetylase (PgdA/CDA1 family)
MLPSVEVARSTPTATLSPNGFPLPPAGPTAVPGSLGNIPILMYHYVRQVDAAADPLGYRLSVTPAQFAAQLDWLDAQGYTPVRMDQAIACMQGAEGCPQRPVALTFDDGYMDAATHALPLLRERGFVATFYIVHGFVGQPGYMGWEELRTLRDAGMQIGAHSLNHLDLTTLAPGAAAAEIGASGEQLAAALDVPITSFCYPAGKFNSATRAQVAQAGYRSAVTTLQGRYTGDAYTLPRLRIEGTISLAGFAALVQSYAP